MYASLRLASGYRATGFSTQSDFLPSACMVELPSKPQRGRSARVGGFSNALIWVLPRSSGMGVLPSSQMYSSLYFVMSFWRSYGFGVIQILDPRNYERQSNSVDSSTS